MPYKNQIKPALLWGNMQREKLSVSCRVCKRYHLLGWCSLPADRVPQGKWWWKTQTSSIHPSIIRSSPHLQGTNIALECKGWGQGGWNPLRKKEETMPYMIAGFCSFFVRVQPGSPQLVCLLACLLCSWPVQWFVTVLGMDAFAAVTRSRYTKGKALQAFFISMPLPGQRSMDLQSSCRSGASNPFFHCTVSCYPRGRCSRLLLLCSSPDLPRSLLSQPVLPTLLQFSTHL